MKVRMARVLRRMAESLDPQPITVLASETGWEIRFDGVPLAVVDPGMVRDVR